MFALFFISAFFLGAFFFTWDATGHQMSATMAVICGLVCIIATMAALTAHAINQITGSSPSRSTQETSSDLG